MKYSVFFRICFLFLALYGCAKAPAPLPDDYASGVQTAKMLVDRYGAVSSPELEDYLSGIVKRLSSGRAQTQRRSSYRVIVLNLGSAQAYSPGASIILLSRGMILSLRSESELAFVLAHEMAHQDLGHTRRPDLNSEGISDNTPDSYTSHLHKELEFEADAYAAALLSRAAYSPSEASHAILNAASARTDLQTDPALESFLNERVSRLSSFRVPSGGFSNPGLPQGREFYRIQASLR